MHDVGTPYAVTTPRQFFLSPIVIVKEHELRICTLQTSDLITALYVMVTPTQTLQIHNFPPTLHEEQP